MRMRDSNVAMPLLRSLSWRQAPMDVSLDSRLQMLSFKLFAIVFEQIFHFDTLHTRERLSLQNRIQRSFFGIPVHQFAAYVVQLDVIRLAEVSLLALLCQRCDLVL